MKCEHLIKVNYEDYGTRALLAGPNRTDAGDCVVFAGFEDEKFYLFVLSIIWRASVSALQNYWVVHPLAAMSDILRPCLMGNGVHTASGVRLNNFFQLTIFRIVDEHGRLAQSAIDSIMLDINKEQGDSPEDGVLYYFMVDGFLIILMMKPFGGSLACITGMRNGDLEVRKVPYQRLKQLADGFEAIKATPDPFSKR